MKVLGSSLIAALANRRSTLINAGVGFSTFAVGDALSQGARRPQQPQIVLAGRRQQQQQQSSSWQEQFIERTRGVDFGRSAKVGLLGILLNGFALGAWYRVLDRYIGSDRTRIQQILKKCVVDQFVYAPFSITSFVSYAAVLNGGGPAQIVGEAKSNLNETFLSTWIMDWKVWPAANLIMFRFIPSSYRPSFASMVQVAWQAYMSSVSYDSPHHSSSPSPSQHQTLANRAGGTAAVLRAGSGSGGGGTVLIRGGGGGGGGGVGVGGELAGAAAVTKQWHGDAGGGRAVTTRREMGVDRRATGRYAYTSSAKTARVPSDGYGGGGGGGGDLPASGALIKNVSNISSRGAERSSSGGGGGGGGGGVGSEARTGAVVETPSFSSSSSPPRPKMKEL
ncbi:unnamed protein product [Pylaiella littoralis]